MQEAERAKEEADERARANRKKEKKQGDEKTEGKLSFARAWYHLEWKILQRYGHHDEGKSIHFLVSAKENLWIFKDLYIHLHNHS